MMATIAFRDEVSLKGSNVGVEQEVPEEQRVVASYDNYSSVAPIITSNDGNFNSGRVERARHLR